jgi:hypothetical protein
MSNTTDKLAIANFGLLSIGDKAIAAIDDTTVPGKRINAIFEKLILELLDEDWNFNRFRCNVSDLTKVFKLTVDTAPTPAAFAVGATLTGATSSVTCTVKRKVSDTVYFVTEPSGDWTDGEVISDGTNSVDCATGYPTEDESPLDTFEYGYVLPTDLLNLRFLSDPYYDRIKLKFYTAQDMLFCNYDDASLVYNSKLEESTGVSDVTLMPLWFHRLISARLAYILAPNVTENMKHRQKAEVEWRDAYIHALEQNADYNYKKEQYGNNDWTEGVEREMLADSAD